MKMFHPPLFRFSLLTRGLLLLGLVWAGLGAAGAANPFVSPLFSSHMVLQRNISCPVWGWTTPATVVTVTMNGHSYTATAGSDGFWKASVGPFAAGGPYTVTVSSPQNTTQTLTDVLMGDVWLCSGQSNMAFTLSSMGGAPVLNEPAEVADSANYPNIRCFTVPNVAALVPQASVTGGSWTVAGPTTTPNYSATAYFSAREIYKQQGVPIGILVSAWPGTEIKSWIAPGTAAAMSDLTQEVFDESVAAAASSNDVSTLYNQMIAPLAGLGIKGVIWYQGEYNTSWPEQYSRLLPGLRSQWRTLFGQPALPFIVIQLPNINGAQTQPVETNSWAELREAQLKSATADANSRIVTTVDIGGGILHPLDKQDVGLRVSWAAANLAYGQTAVVGQGPVFTGAVISGSNVVCSFSNTGSGLMVGTKTPLSPTQPVTGGVLKGFALAGANKTFFSANAVISGNTVVVSSPSVSSPVAVRYGWGSNPPCNLYNKITAPGGGADGIPASPFRNDPVYLLTVNSGSGTGHYALNTAVPVAATASTGLAFFNWSGDTGALSSVTSPSATATVSQVYTSLLATYTVTGAPTGLAATPDIGQIALAWNAMPGVHYNLKRSTVSGGPYAPLASNLVGTTSYADETVTSGVTYYYVISAVGMRGEGPNSAPLAATPTPAVQNVQALPGAARVTVSWPAFNGAATYYNVKRATAITGPYTTLSTGSPSRSYVDTAVASGTAYYYAVSAVTAAGETADSLPAAALPTFLPAPLANQEIGSVGRLGGAFTDLAAGTYTTVGSGTGIGTSPDSFNFTYATLSGNGSLTARVASQQAGGTPKAGIMMRATLDPASPYAMTYVTPTQCFYQGRYTQGGNPGTAAITSTNRWIRVVRTGNSFVGYISPDGTTWTQLGGTVSFATSAPVYIGFADCSGDNTTTNTATFDSVTAPWTLQAPAVPAGFRVAAAPAGATQTTLSWTAVPGAAAYNVKRATGSAGPFTTVASGIDQVAYTATGLATPYSYVVSARDAAGESGNSAPLLVPSALQDQDIGTVGAAGSASTGTDGSIVVSGAGSGIGVSPDSFHFATLRLSGDGTLTARVAFQGNTPGNPLAGVMMRASLDPGAMYAMTYVTPTRCFYQGRYTQGGSTGTAAITSTNRWIRVVRSGSSFTGYISPDGATWTQLGTAVHDVMADPIYVGFAVESGDTRYPNTAGFDNVTLTTP